MSLYTLATLACLPERVSTRLAGSSGLNTDECEAQFHFWQRIGSWMGIEDIPDTRGELLAWMHAFEDERFAATTECHAIAEALAREWADYRFPKAMQATGRGVFMAMIEPDIPRRLCLPEPSRFQNAMAGNGIPAFFAAKRVLPDPLDRPMTDHFAAAYAQPLDLNKVGHDAPR